jgi:hypothetical protein
VCLLYNRQLGEQRANEICEFPEPLKPAHGSLPCGKGGCRTSRGCGRP